MNKRKNTMYYWAFLLPCLLALFFIIFLPLIYGIYYSFTNSNGFQSTFIGLENYKRILKDIQFLKSLSFTFRFTIVSVIGVNVIGLGFALLVTQKMGKLSTVFRTIFFMPNLIGGIILGFIWQFVFINAFQGIASITNLTFFNGWLADATTGFWGLVILFLWQMSGYIMLIYISFLNGIPDELLEAADIDGASPWKKFWRIKFPMVAPAFTISLFLTLSNAFKVYDQNLALTAGGPFGSTEMVAMNIYNTAFVSFEQGYAQAKAIIFFVIVAVISIVQIYVTRKREVDL